MSTPRRILVVDDEQPIVDILREHFQGRYEVDTAADGAEAVGRIRAHEPDVVLLDISMPGMSGLEVLRRIKEASEAIPVIMLTANGDNAIAVDATPSSGPLSGLTVLIVEDDADLRDMLAFALKVAGAYVVTASSAAEALRKATTSALPGCIVTDLHLGNESGFKLLGAVRSNGLPAIARVPMVAITGRSEYVRGMVEVPFNERLLKPVLPEDLVAAVLRCTKGKAG